MRAPGLSLAGQVLRSTWSLRWTIARMRVVAGASLRLPYSLAAVALAAALDLAGSAPGMLAWACLLAPNKPKLRAATSANIATAAIRALLLQPIVDFITPP